MLLLCYSRSSAESLPHMLGALWRMWFSVWGSTLGRLSTLCTLKASLECKCPWSIPQPFPDDGMWVDIIQLPCPLVGTEVCPSCHLQMPHEHQPPAAHSSNACPYYWLPSPPNLASPLPHWCFLGLSLVIKPWLESLLLDIPKIRKWPQIWHQTEIQELSPYAWEK